MDDFYSPERLKRFPIDILNKIRLTLEQNNLDFWSVLYETAINNDDIKKYYDCFSGITQWMCYT